MAFAAEADQAARVQAHRTSTISLADRIVVIDEGRVAQIGTYIPLLAGGGTLARLLTRSPDEIL